MKRVCVYCGSSPGARPEYTESAKQLAQALVARGIDLVYGGASVGIMGVMADAVLAAGGNAIGVIPRALFAKEVAHTGLSELRTVHSMHERKALMVELADAFIALPGGLGTLDELFEITTWAQLGMHRKPIGLLNVRQYYQKLLDFLEHTVSEQYVRREHLAMLLVDEDPQVLLDRLEEYRAPELTKWIDRETI